MPIYVRVEDSVTGHQYDVDHRSLLPGMKPVEGYPPNSGPGAIPRPPKHRVAKDGKPSRPRRITAKPPATTPPAETEQEQS